MPIVAIAMPSLRHTIAVLVVVLLAYYGYNLLGTVTSANRAGIPVWSAMNQATLCEKEPTSRCFADLAVLSLKPHQRLSGVGGADLELRYVGRGEFADSAIGREDRRWIRGNQIAQQMYESLLQDTEQFLATTPTASLNAYMAAYAFLQDDTSYYSISFPVGEAVSVARSRLGAPFASDETIALMQKWRQSLDRHAQYSSDWLNYAIYARELTQVEQAKEALEKAEALGWSNTNRTRAIVETWHLYGAIVAVEKILEFADTNTRAEAFLKLSDLAAQSGDTELSVEMYAGFLDNYDREKPIRHPVVWQHMADRAARVTHIHGNETQTRSWANVYAKETNYYNKAERVRYSGRLYAEVGMFNEAIAVAEDAIAHAPAPEETLLSSLPQRKIGASEARHNSTVGYAIGIYCLAGEFDTAFELAARNPAYGATAAAGCLAAVEAENASMTIEEVESALGSNSWRPIRGRRAATAVELGDYRQAAELIESLIDLESQHDSVPRAIENTQMLRLAVAIRDEPLTRKIMKSIAGDAGELSGQQAVRVFAAVAAHTKAWPDADTYRIE